MIQRKPNNRLGNQGYEEIKQHPWFKGFAWEKLVKKEMQAPFVPSVRYIYITPKKEVGDFGMVFLGQGR